MALYLVDGTFELFRAHYGAPPHTTAEGQQVGAARGLTRSLIALLNQPGVTHVACAFDHVIESFRNQLFAGYKTGDGIDPVLLSQFPLAEQVSRALGIVTWPMVEFEADDAIATAAKRFSEQIDQVVICSPDKDLAQCVLGERIVTLDRLRNRTLDEEGVKAKFGVPPASIPDYLALVGDQADGLPGVPRWGAKSSAAVLAHYRHLDAIPEAADAWTVAVRGAKALAQSLCERQADARLYRTLATLRTDVPLAETLEVLRYRGPDPRSFETLCATLEEDPERLRARLPRPPAG